jgi:hypothetical protein
MPELMKESGRDLGMNNLHMQPTLILRPPGHHSRGHS